MTRRSMSIECANLGECSDCPGCACACHHLSYEQMSPEERQRTDRRRFAEAIAEQFRLEDQRDEERVK